MVLPAAERPPPYSEAVVVASIPSVKPVFRLLPKREMCNRVVVPVVDLWWWWWCWSHCMNDDDDDDDAADDGHSV